MERQKGHFKYQETTGDNRHFKFKSIDGYFTGSNARPTTNETITPEIFGSRNNAL